MKKYLCFLFLLMLYGITHAVTPTTEGKEFWVTFMKNQNTQVSSSALELKLIVSARENATVTMRNPQTGWQQSLQVVANQVAEYVLPKEQVYTYNAGIVEKTGIVVTSTAPVSLYAANFREHTYDATIVMPITALETDYVVQVYENDLMAKELAVVATTNNTQVTITPHARTTSGQVKGVPFTVTLQRGEVYQLMSNDGGNDFSGTRVQSDKAVAVFAGHQCINIPTGNPWCDHIVEQQMPTRMWGRQFVVTKTKGQNGDRVMLTAVNDNTQLYVNGTLKTTLNALQSYEFRLTDNSAYIETSEPTTCYLYVEGARDNNMIGDPSSVHVSPIEQRIKQLTFSTFQTTVSRTHYVNIVTTKAGVNSIKLDGNIISNEFITVQGNANLMYAQIQVQNGTHTLETNIDGFVGHVYGLGRCESYAYTFGSATIPLVGQIVVNGESRADVEYNETRCYKQELTFEPQANVEFNTIHWDLGDGTTSSSKAVKHTYASAGTYRVRMIITNEEGRDTAYANLILVEQLRDTVYAKICNGDKYVYNGRAYTQTGKYDVKLQSKYGCDSIVTLMLTVNDTYLVEEKDSFPKGLSYRWHGNWYSEEGMYYDTLTSVSGCDSIIKLILTKTDPTEVMYDTICWQPTYEFRGYTYTIPPYSGFEHLDYIDYVLENRDKEACVSYKMHLAIAPMVDGNSFVEYDTIQKGGVYEWMGERLTEKGTYNKIVYQACECAIDYTLHLEVLTFPLTKHYVELCHNDEYEFRGKTYNEPGVYYDTVWTMTGIEAIYEIKLVDARKRTEISVSNVSSYVFNGKTYTKSGTYIDTLQAENGCDSIVTLYLGIREKCTILVEETIRICEGDVYEWNGQNCVAGKIYTKTFVSSGGCDSVVTLHVEPISKYTTHLLVSICSGDYYKIGEMKLYTEGEHIVNFVSSEGCDSVVVIQLSYNETYNIVDKVKIKEGESYMWNGENYNKAGVYHKACIATNGCDSVVTLELNVSSIIIAPEENVTICYGETYRWRGVEYSASGIYVDTLQTDKGYDSVVTLNLTILPEVVDYEENATICYGKTYKWRGVEYSKVGVYRDTLQTDKGCDSVVTLNLTVLPEVVGYEESATICYEETYKWRGVEYSKSGTYVDTLQTDKGCDSIVTLNLTILPEVVGAEENVTICFGETYTWRGVEYSKSGIYVDTLQTDKGCDSVVILKLTVLPEVVGAEESATICYGETYQWEGVEYSKSGIYVDTLQTDKGCDSVVILKLTVLPEVVGAEESAIICYGETYKWRGVEYSVSGIYVDTLQTDKGCDSLVTLNLTVLSEVVGAEESATICYGETYQWHEKEYLTTGIYVDTLKTDEGCDSVVMLNLMVLENYYFTENATIKVGKSYNWHGKTLRVEGVYFDSLLTVGGCDSIYALTLTVDENYEPMVIDCDEAVDLGLSVDWAPFNLGATKPEEYGDYFAWGETKPKGYYFGDTYKFGDLANFTKYNSVDGLTRLALEDDAAAVNWGGYWRMPTVAEMEELFDNCSWTWTTQNGTNGYRVTGRNGKSIFLPAAGFSDWDDFYDEGEFAGYWMSELGPYVSDGTHLAFTKNAKFKNKSFFRYRGYSIRPVCVMPEIVEDTVTVCAGESYWWNGMEYSASGVYVDTLQNVNGKDSIIILNLTVLPEIVGVEENVTICYGEIYTWRGVEYSNTGVYCDTLQSAQGCDSVVTLNLKVAHSYSSGETVTIQLGESYEWRGESYTAPGVYFDKLLTVDGCDSVFTLTIIRQDVVVDAINIAEQCAGTGVLDVEVLLRSGSVDEVSFIFNQDAINAGFVNITLPYNEQMQVQYTDVRAGRYKVTVMGLFNGEKVFEEEKDLIFLYPSTVLMQKWNDVVAVLTHDYNGGYNFVDFQWYKNGVVLSGETRSYIHQPLELGAEYSALLTEDNGLKMMTCPLIATNLVDISLYPTLLNGGQRVRCNLSESAVVYVYDMMGKLLSKLNVQSGETEMEMPYVAGVYVVKIVTNSNDERNIKLIVR